MFLKDLRGERETRDSLERDARKKAFKEMEEQKKIDEKLKQEEKVIKGLLKDFIWRIGNSEEFTETLLTFSRIVEAIPIWCAKRTWSQTEIQETTQMISCDDNIDY